tara:strand:+ start:191 stop:523 length:333 start_codon:yes stop_codon:yes gene_type:complete
MPEDLFHVLAKAVESYKAANVRGRNKPIHGKDPQRLVKTLPDYYFEYGDGKVRFLGDSAEEILETYLQDLGYERGSSMWLKLASDVIDLAQEDYEPDQAYLGGGKKNETG